MESSLSGWCKEFVAGLPEAGGAGREEAILEAVGAGKIAPITWVEVRSKHGEHSTTLFVSADALRVGDETSSIRINATARTTQRIADLLDCVLPTPKICDLIWEQATVRISPCLQTPDKAMGNTSRMVQHHEAIEKKVAGRAGLIENIGKHWVLSNRLANTKDLSANYGWYDKGAAHAAGAHRLWQPVGLKHNLDHVDYSQVVRLVKRRCMIDGAEHDLTQIMVDPALAPLASGEGPLRLVRLPGL
jgi:hypothetical protein